MKASWIPRSGLTVAVLLLSVALGNAQGTQLLVSNVQVQQRQFTAIWDVTYDLETIDDTAVTVSLSLSTDLGVTYPHPCVAVTGDIGGGVMPGTGKHIAWNAGADCPGLISSTCQLQVTADDGQIEIPEGFVIIPPGSFQMGSPEAEPGHQTFETLHTVTLTRGFYISRCEVTEQWWDQIMGSGVSTSQMVKNASWDEAVLFCNALSSEAGLTPAYTVNGPNGDVVWNREAEGYRLPTEAEWEYACRAGNQAAFCNGPITYTGCSPLDPKLDQVGWYCGHYENWPHEVGQKTPNNWGLHDMHGNVNEWVWDGWLDDYENLPQVDPVFEAGPGEIRVARGGYFGFFARTCRSASRTGWSPTYFNNTIGFRPVRAAF